MGSEGRKWAASWGIPAYDLILSDEYRGDDCDDKEMHDDDHDDDINNEY